MSRLLARRRRAGADAGLRTATRPVHGASAGRRARAHIAGRPAGAALQRARTAPRGNARGAGRAHRAGLPQRRRRRPVRQAWRGEPHRGDARRRRGQPVGPRDLRRGRVSGRVARDGQLVRRVVCHRRRAGRADRTRAGAAGRRRVAAHVPRGRPRTPAHGAAHEHVADARQPGRHREPGVPTPALRDDASVRHRGERHAGVGEGAHGRRPARVSPGAVPPGRRAAHRRRRRETGRRAPAARTRVQRLERVGGLADAGGRARRPPAGGAPRGAGRQAGRRAVADSHRVDWRAAQHGRLFPADRREHDPWRLVHLAA